MNRIIIADADTLPLDKMLGKRILEKLHEHYPGWTWLVDVQPGQNIVTVRNLDCDPYGRMGFVIYKDRLYGDPHLHKIMLAGGEFLERYRMRRAGFDAAQLAGRIMHLERPDS